MSGQVALDLTREVSLELVLSVFNDPRVVFNDSTKVGYFGPPGLGTYYVQEQGGPPAGLLFCCPGDGKVSSIAFVRLGDYDVWSWNGNREKPTTKPSIHCNPAKGGCGWHGWLTDGRFHR